MGKDRECPRPKEVSCLVSLSVFPAVAARDSPSEAWRF